MLRLHSDPDGVFAQLATDLQSGHLDPIQVPCSHAPGQLTRVSGMVQNVLDHEFIAAEDSQDPSSFIKRLAVAVVPIPGLSSWAQQSNTSRNLQVLLYGAFQDQIRVCQVFEFYGYADEAVENRFHCCTAIRTLRIPALVDFDSSHMKSLVLAYCLHNITFGDKNAAELLFLSLLASPISRGLGLVVGTLPLNLVYSSEQVAEKAVSGLVGMLELIFEKFRLLSIDRDALSKDSFVSKKDYETMELSQGLLQVSDSTVLVLDESRMTPGSLDQTAVQNLKSLVSVIEDQEIILNFDYHQVQIPLNLPVVSMSSESKSILPFKFNVRVNPFDEGTSLDYTFSSKLLPMLRSYIHQASSLTFKVKIPEEISQVFSQSAFFV